MQLVLMDLYKLSFFLVSFLIAKRVTSSGPSFSQNYKITWGHDHVYSSSQGREVRLRLDHESGSGFTSKSSFGSGSFHMNIKLPGNANTAGVVVAFYLTSQTGGHRDELDLEFLGSKERVPYMLQTNVYINGIGRREKRIHLWFDPTTSYHDYKILWNPHQIVFFVDDKPIRVFQNKQKLGVGYPKQPMNVVASIWNGDWATNGGQTKIDWRYAPFIASFRSFGISGCNADNGNMQACYTDKFWWNRLKKLSYSQEKSYENVKRNYMVYDYCTDKKRHRSTPPECPQ